MTGCVERKKFSIQILKKDKVRVNGGRSRENNRDVKC